MTIKVSTIYPDNNHTTINIDFFDPKLQGQTVTIKFIRKFEIRKNRGEDQTEVLFEKTFKLLKSNYSFNCDEVCIPIKTDELSISGEVEVRVNRDWALDKKVKFPVKFNFPRRSVREDAQDLLKPKDKFNLLSIISTMNPGDQGMVKIVISLGVILLLGVNIVGFHDLMVFDPHTWYWSHPGAGGESPLFSVLYNNLAVAVSLIAFVKGKIKPYASFKIKERPKITPLTKISASKLIGGKTNIKLDRVIVRVVAGNTVHGFYQTGGKNRRRVKINSPLIGVKLFEQRIMRIKAGTKFSDILEGEVDFSPIFESLYPNMMMGKSGISLDWQIQLIHAEFLDIIEIENNIKTELVDFVPHRNSRRVAA